MSHTLISRTGADRQYRSRTRITGEFLSILIVLIDVAAVVAMSVASGAVYHQFAYDRFGDLETYLRIGAVVALVVVVSNLSRGEYQLSNFIAGGRHVRRTVQLWNVTFVCLLVLGFITKVSDIYSRGWIVLYYVSGLPMLLLLRYATAQIVRRWAAARLIATKRAFIIGNAGEIERFLRRYDPRQGGMEILGCRFLSEATQSGPDEERAKLLRRELETVIPSIRQLEPDAIYIITPWSDHLAIDACIESLLTLPAEIHLGPGYALQRYSNAQLARSGSIASLEVVRLPLTRFERFQKRTLDVLLSTLGLVLIAPLLCAIAVLIKLDSPGPAFFLQRRYGFNQKPFRIIKFRTMVAMDDGPVVRQATRNDPRVTRVGRWLRAWNIDELPQLINVLRGEMSLVGPRPHALSHNREYEHIIARYAARHNVKPGITGWAQVHGIRGETDTPDKMRQRVEYDLHYIENWSLMRDLTILVWTVVLPSAYRNAH
jgi:Undecaprenyl-phosphate glucose phosphotransferase